MTVLPGAVYLGDGVCRFNVWAPNAERVDVQLFTDAGSLRLLQPGSHGYHSGDIHGVRPGMRYKYVLDGDGALPDPASRYQPEGVHGPSEVCSTEFPWTDDQWKGIPLEDYVIYELHTGTFTPEGTFDAVACRLSDLKALGITAVELMPVAQFPGERNWGYDGAYPYAVHNSYGGPAALKCLIDACHSEGLAVILDVVYNHFGPEGNYAGRFGPYFTERYHTPWGGAMNFDGPGSDEVRHFFIENAACWLREFHFDALRLDALHAIMDMSARPFLAELAARVAHESSKTGRHMYLIGENDLNDPRLLRRPENGGIGIDAQWNDDFHHSLHVLLTGEQTGYYVDFGSIEQLERAFRDGFVYAGHYSQYRQRRHGAPSSDLFPHQFVGCSQNHDQIGNRAIGDRLSTIVSFESLKLAAACTILSPHIPLIFMGEEYGETAPFPYFVSHSDPALVEAVRKGRSAEFSAFGWKGTVPDPQDNSTFLSAKLDWNERTTDYHGTLLELYRELLSLRRTVPALHKRVSSTASTESQEGRTLLLQREHDGDEVVLILNFSQHDMEVSHECLRGQWTKLLDSSDSRWGGPDSTRPDQITVDSNPGLRIDPQSAVLLFRRAE
ncbi:MAG: malto-oligosyltrehalose trehalohydrolase [Dehalococcoidia bacterium]|nr:malto-oligosyltrehalose trehalohydrolase [Dehalococcoidia bacterium]